MNTDEELLNRIKKDPSCFGELFHLYYRVVFGYLFRRTAAFETAQDIASETFHKAFIHIHRFDYRGVSLKVWLYRIATNEINAYYRQRKRQLRTCWPNEDDPNAMARSEDRHLLEEELVKHQRYKLLLGLIRQLKDKYQHVLFLRYFEDKSIKEIAQIINVKEGTIKSLLSRGIAQLRNNPGAKNLFEH